VARIGLLPRVRCLRSLIYANTPRRCPPPNLFSRGGRRSDFSLFGVFDHFVEGLPSEMPRKPA